MPIAWDLWKNFGRATSYLLFQRMWALNIKITNVRGKNKPDFSAYNLPQETAADCSRKD